MKKRILSIVLTLCMVLMLVPISASAMVLYVDLNITGAAQLTLEVESGDSIDNVKSRIENETGYSKTIQILMYDGQVLQNERTLADYNIQKESTIELSLSSSFEPSVTTYATKEQLMDDTFAPNANGTANNIGKLVFGKKSDGVTSQDWYILGEDDGVNGENTVIFAASRIETEQVFKSGVDSTPITDNNLWSDSNYEDGVNITEVYRNHYGASELRDALQQMATNADYFTTSEQSLMNDTTVTTMDNKNSAEYTTTDKLYALVSGKIEGNNVIKAGSSNQKILGKENFFNNEIGFWLRSPHSFTGSSQAVKSNGIFNEAVYNKQGVRPASNLNLSNVRFASAAQAASSSTATSGKITSDTAMTLRLDGSSKNIGTITYNTTSGDIKATKRSTTGDVALVVQGNDGTDDWYFSKKITDTETVNVSDMKSSLSISADIDLSKCKIWLETTDNGMIYASAVNECSTETELRNALGAEVTSIMLTDDITLSGTLGMSNKITILDLNGHVIKMNGSGSVIRVNSNCSLTLQDSRPDAKHTGANDSLPVGGVITGGKATGDGGGGVQICSNGTFTMNGGTISECSAIVNGGGVLNVGSFTMNGGTISNCSAANGDGVFNKGSFTMNGGSIVNYTASSNAGVGVYNENGATEMRANGGEITGLRNNAFRLSIEKDEGKSGTTFYGDVVNTLSTINAGTYKGTVTNYKGSSDMVPGTISGGIFEGTVINRDEGVISGGIYYGGIQNDDSSTVTDTYYTVSFELNGASGTIPTQWFVNADNAKVRQPEDPVREGYLFLGWYNGDAKYDFTKPVTKNIALTAKWVSENVSNETELKDALSLGSNFIRLAANFNLSSKLNLSDKIITLDLNGHTLTGNIILADRAASPKSILTLVDSNPAAGGVVKGDIELTDGSHGNASYLYANGGTITGKVSLNSYIAKIYCTSDTPTAIKGYVGTYGEIHGGMFYGTVKTSCIKEKTITFKNGNSTYAYEVVASGNNTVAPANPSIKTGYTTFDGWYDGETKYTFGSSLSKDITLTAKFSNPITYNITYNLNGGTVENQKSYNVESEAITLNNPVKKGYTFTGWSGSDLTGENNMSVTIPKGSTGNRTYTAHFSENSYTVVFNTVGGSDISDKTDVKWTGKVLEGIADPAKNGWGFKGWKCGDVNVNADTRYADLVTDDATASITIVAQWELTCEHDGEVNKIEAVAATCTSDGNIEYWQCPVCDCCFSSKPAKGDTPMEAGSWIVKEKGHNAGTTEIVKATTTANGVLNQKCTECNETLATTVIPKISSIKLSATSYTYDGKTKTPKLNVIDAKGNVIPSGDYTVSYANGRKNVGSYKVTVTFKSTSDKYSGSKDTYFNINPKGTSIASVAGSSKAFTVKWKKQSTKMATSTITGYQIRYSTSSKMTGAKTKTVKGYKYTSKKITKLKAKKKYYVQVRAYKTVSGKIYYSSWSKVKSVKTK